MTYQTIDQVREAITEMLGEHAGAHDVTAIIDATIEYRPGTGFVQTVTADAFWAAVEAAAL